MDEKIEIIEDIESEIVTLGTFWFRIRFIHLYEQNRSIKV